MKFNNFNSVTHCIFDMDGLILDTETLAFKVTQNVLDIVTGMTAKHTWENKEKLLGLTANDVAKKIVEMYKLNITWEEYKAMAKDEMRNVMKDCEVCEGASRLISHLYAHKIPICVATSSSAVSLKIKTQKHKKLFEKFDHIVTGGSDEEVKRGKPAPDIFLVAAGRFEEPPKPENCLVFEDSPSGVRAALDAGMQVVAIPDHRVSKDKVQGATLILNSLMDFDPETFGLPPFNEE